jgi:hypothetical protein
MLISRALLTVAVIAFALAGSVPGARSEVAPTAHGPTDTPAGQISRPARIAEGKADKALEREFLVGVWETRNNELGRDVQVIWTARSDGSLDYDFVIDGVTSRGSTGTWDFRDGILVEKWHRNDGSTAIGRGSIEKLDDNTFRLTVIDNGHPEYRGLQRIYRRLRAPQTVQISSPLG